jgi:cell division septal protein FtsQ
VKEQVITPRAPARSPLAGKGRAGGAAVQKPARRDKGSAEARARGGSLRGLLAYFPVAGKLALAVVTGLLIFTAYRSASSASFFQARSIDVSGTSRASGDEIRNVVRRAVATGGVWRADLDAISKELKAIAWVREAVVSRVLPDGLRVRITERQPRAVVRTTSGKFIWVDEDAVNVGAASPTDRIFMRGWEEAATETARAQNQERVKRFLEMTRDWESRGISRRVSEVNLSTLQDVRAQLSGDDSQIELRLGKEDFGNRLQKMLAELDRQKQLPRGHFITYLLWVADGERGENHINIGFSPNAQSPVEDAAAASSNDAGTTGDKPAPRAPERARESSRKPDSTAPAARRASEQQRKKEPDKKDKEKKDKPAVAAKTETRPRRVGQ